MSVSWRSQLTFATADHMEKVDAIAIPFSMSIRCA